jgi:DNA-binding LacI/PurR family transcriptional regulator
MPPLQRCHLSPSGLMGGHLRSEKEGSMIRMQKSISKKPERVTLKTVAERVGLAPGTVSLVLNQAPGSESIPQRTKDRVFAAARALKYQPNPLARALRTQQGPAPNIGEQFAGDAGGALMFVGAEHLLRALHAIREAGLRVPGDVSIVGFDHAQMAALNRSASAA